MKTKLYSAIAGAALMAASGLAMAETPLTTSQMDAVSAGSVAEAYASATALAGVFAQTLTATVTGADALAVIPFQVGSVWLTASAAASQSTATAVGTYVVP